MDHVGKFRWLWSIAVWGVLCLIACCGGFGYAMYRKAHVYVETYEPTMPLLLNGSEVKVDVSVHHRIRTGWGESLVGPPYWFQFFVPDASGVAISGKLHSLIIIDAQGNQLTAEITKGENQLTNKSIFLSGRMEQGDLGVESQLIADVELVMPDRSVREDIKFSLRRAIRASLNVR